jgi:TPR repeat protein
MLPVTRSFAPVVANILLLAALAGCAARDPRVLSPADVAAGCSATTPAPCEAACLRDGAAACAIFGAAAEGSADPPVRLPQDRPRARRALERGCNLGNLDACRVLASLDTEAAGPGRDCAAWESICRRGDRRSCTFFAECIDHDEGFRRDRAQARRIFEEGCAQGERVACRELATLTMSGDGVPRDEVKAFSLLDKACGLDDPLACAYEGASYEHGLGVERDVERAKVLYRAACQRGIRPIPFEGLRRLGETPPSSLVSSADAKETSFVSTRFDYEWRLPANWELVDPSALDLHDVPSGFEAVAARPRGGASHDTLMLVATDLGQDARDANPKVIVDAFEAWAAQWFLFHGVSRSSSTRKKFLGQDALRVDGQYGMPKPRFFTMTAFAKDRRRFELRCLTDDAQPGIPCREAFGALMIHEPKPDERHAGRILHVREPRFGLAFDAPDDTWLARDPRVGVGGRQLVWTWINGRRRIELSAFDLASSSPSAFELTISSIAESFRADGGAVVRTDAVLGGEHCVHLQLDKAGKEVSDGFLQRRGDKMYIVVVFGPTRDADLLERVRAGVRFELPAR